MTLPRVKLRKKPVKFINLRGVAAAAAAAAAVVAAAAVAAVIVARLVV